MTPREASIAIARAGYVSLSWRLQRRRAERHSLPGRLTVNVTSHPPRFPTLALTLKSLLAQSIRPDRYLLWIAEADFASLPAEVIRLQAAGLEIRTCEDLRSYNKIIPALASAGGDFLVTADDDAYYPRHWLRELVEAYRAGRKEVLCARAHRIGLDERRMPLPYSQWEKNVAAGDASPLLFPTGVGGVLYEPGIFHADVTRADIFSKVCPTADDIWLYWMAALNGARFRKVGPVRPLVIWVHTQRFGLFEVNRTANDEQIAKMTALYGFPF